jgi:hypothetical protein
VTADPDLAIGAIMQLDPNPAVTRNPMFCGCMFVITEPKPWGAQGFVQGLGENGQPAGQAYYRAHWAEMESTGGFAEWMPAHHGEAIAAQREAKVLVPVEKLRQLLDRVDYNTTLLDGITGKAKPTPTTKGPSDD